MLGAGGPRGARAGHGARVRDDVEFDTASGRTGDFAGIDWWIIRSSAREASSDRSSTSCSAFLALYVACAGAWRSRRAVPAVGRLRDALRDRMRRLVSRLGLDSPAACHKLWPSLGLTGLALVVWRFWPLLIALLGDINSGSTGKLPLLGSQNEHMQLVFRRSTELLIVLLATGLLGVDPARLAGRRIARPPRATLVVIGMALVLLVLPWRLVFHADFRKRRSTAALLRDRRERVRAARPLSDSALRRATLWFLAATSDCNFETNQRALRRIRAASGGSR